MVDFKPVKLLNLKIIKLLFQNCRLKGQCIGMETMQSHLISLPVK